MKECVWVKPRIVAEIEFLEWTGADHLRHTKFVGLRDDKDPRTVMRDQT
jgi:ATP-dependent DNA ligase